MENQTYQLAQDADMIAKWEAEQLAQLDGSGIEAFMMDQSIAKGGF